VAASTTKRPTANPWLNPTISNPSPVLFPESSPDTATPGRDFWKYNKVTGSEIGWTLPSCNLAVIEPSGHENHNCDRLIQINAASKLIRKLYGSSPNGMAQAAPVSTESLGTYAEALSFWPRSVLTLL